MIITPAIFEDTMKNYASMVTAEAVTHMVALMCSTLESLGYEKGIEIFTSVDNELHRYGYNPYQE